MAKFSVGYNFDFEEFKKILKKYKRNIESVYFPIPKKYMGSGRILDEPPDYKENIVRLIEICQKHKINALLLLNSTVITPSQIKNAIKYLKKLEEKGLAIGVTVTDPYLIMNIRKEFPGIFIEASTLCRIRTVQEAKYFKEIGANRITTGRETIRNIPLLNKIKKVLPLKVLANEGCIKNCIYRYAHYNLLSTNPDDLPLLPVGTKYKERKQMLEDMDHLCAFTVSKHPYKVFSAPFIRPEDIKRYKEVTNVFKLSTRNFSSKRIETVLKAYINKKHDGNLVELLNTSYIQILFKHINNKALNNVDFFETLASCDDNCEDCDYCNGLLKHVKLIRQDL